jgi:EAL domain-containing protein (putative c-di-GMP-specific phosphodiesterase class I)
MFPKGSAPNPPPWRSLGTSDKHKSRVKMLLVCGSGMVMTLGAGWGSYYVLQAKWLLATMDIAMTAAGALAMWCALTDRLRPAAVLGIHALLAVITGFCMLDVPLPQVPRSAHMHLITLAAACVLLFRGERFYLRLVLPVACFAIALLFAGSSLGVSDPMLMPPPQTRAIGVWINNLTCFLAVGMVLWIMQADVSVRNAIESDLRTAVANSQFVLHYQPQIDDGGRVIGAEALLRWQHPQRGMIPPAKFIPVAEETGLIVPIGEWVLKKACAQLVAWAANPDTAHITLAVNVSAQQFRQPDFVGQVLEILARSGARASHLKLELTESMLVKDLDEVVAKMSALKDLGVGFSLDDFGTGFSSLSYIKRLPLDQIKIDQSFVRDLPEDPNDMAIVRTLVGLGRSLGLAVIAEGVETDGQRAWLAANDCHAFQGYLFSKPVPVDQFDAFVREHAEAARPVADRHLAAEPA